jgi:benzoyl-CoA 2,3-dioxygenase component B
MQRYVNFWFSSALDLFGSESSTNAALYFAAGIKGRPDEAKHTDHLAVNETYDLDVPGAGGGIDTRQVPLRNAMNAVTRAAYAEECDTFVRRWNKTITDAGFDFRFALPSLRFHRTIGAWAGCPTNPAGERITAEEYARGLMAWLPSQSDQAFIASLMVGVIEPGKMASWIAPPEQGINRLPLDFEYVRLS